VDPTVSHFRAGQQIRVPNVGADRIDANAVPDARWRDTLAMLGVSSDQPQATKIVVSKSKGTLRAYDATGKLVGMYTATMGSQHDPLPLGRWKVVGISRDPDFTLNPDLFWDVSDREAKQHLPPGPNGPVGVAWIDLNKPHYGIHGTPEPQTIGRAQSHGCVRLTNWDVARLVQMVKPGAQVLFEA
jgi:lipoprotein-anchoring transpeptidase ErfK/SrfK